ncbi:hypothetical protein [Allostreptomyces psammosilenae]|uniref:Protein kinase domain-containing protein n=1 Tax=Allostreptomyces psammosilenae TaxID=1892865 RepID=A0A852ZXJ9_9ACTN|nr:hypothetical protein [Allostreptomyces psammosilenae]NYI05970.1 hypothetical protein [Allostreptomyces psammosilenae]
MPPRTPGRPGSPDGHPGTDPRLLAGRYLLQPSPDDPLPPGVHAALDTHSGTAVLAERITPPVPGGNGGPVPRPAERAAALRHAADRARATAEALPDHPRLVQVYQVVVEHDRLWVITERPPAWPLSRILAEAGQLSPARAVEIAADVADALDAVHRAGRPHLALTPDTVLICEDGRAMLTGTVSGAARRALAGRALDGGGPAGRPLGAATDLRDLGVLLHHCAVGHPPAATPTPLPPLADALGPVLRRLLATDPTAPPARAAEIRETLRDLAARATEPRPGVHPGLPVAAATVDTTLAAPPPAHHSSRHRRRGAGAPAVVEVAEAAPGRAAGRAPAEPSTAPGGRRRGPRFLGMALLVVVLLLMVAAVVVIVVLNPGAEAGGAAG